MSSSKATSQSAQVRHATRFLEIIVHLRGIAGTIVHPKATIFAIAGPIVIGTGCIIEEGAIIVNRSAAEPTSMSSAVDLHLYLRRKEVMRIGDDNLFEIGCRMSVRFSLSNTHRKTKIISQA